MDSKTSYVLPEENRSWKDEMWIVMFLKGAAYRILGIGELPDSTGLTITTETPIQENHRKRLGLEPLKTP